MFLAYYPALCALAVIFSSFWLILACTTAVAVIYSFVSVMAGPGLDLDTGDEKVLLARLAVMYLIAVGICLIVNFERVIRQAATAGALRMQRERIELSQTIHDTTAQTAYMIGMGIESAVKLAGEENPKLAQKFLAMAELSRSAMWELRRPIDMGRIFEGRELARVLGSHTATFAKIASVPAEMTLSSEEPQLSMEVRVGLFSIAHNALSNAFLHARAGKVEVSLKLETDLIRLSVSDDSVGLPEDYCERGRGFGGMEKSAGRMDGKLVVESERGTTVTCVVPFNSDGRKD